MPCNIAYLAFTKKAAEEAKERSMKKFNLYRQDLPYFRTIHSLAFLQLQVERTQVVQVQHYKEVGNSLGLDLSGEQRMEDGLVITKTEDDKLIFVEDLARKRMKALEDQWAEQDCGVSWNKLELYARTYKEYKRAKSLMDFTDMLHKFLAMRNCRLPTFDLMVVDEAQDLSDLQWAIFRKLAEGAKSIIVAGDDDQAIYKWSGANVQTFIDMPGEKIVLSKSYRLPLKIFNLANKVANSISYRKQKEFMPNRVGGEIEWYSDVANVDLSQGQWLVLARNGYLVTPVKEICEESGYNYSYMGFRTISPELIDAILAWEDYRHDKRKLHDDEWDRIFNYVRKADRERKDLIWHEAFTKLSITKREYMAAIHRRGEALTREPRIRISTIHAAKGGEADNILLLTDIGYTCYKELEQNPDDELRVLYVAVTRARNKLHIVSAKTQFNYEGYL